MLHFLNADAFAFSAALVEGVPSCFNLQNGLDHYMIIILNNRPQVGRDGSKDAEGGGELADAL
jgi:hypothetical protein